MKKITVQQVNYKVMDVLKQGYIIKFNNVVYLLNPLCDGRYYLNSKVRMKEVEKLPYQQQLNGNSFVYKVVESTSIEVDTTFIEKLTFDGKTGHQVPTNPSIEAIVQTFKKEEAIA